MLIKCGNPAEGPATYTRFILPFAYCPTACSFTNSNAKSNNLSYPYYEETEPDDLIWRKQYPTYETADVLFKRAKWFTLKDSIYPLKVNMHFRDCGEDDYITVRIKPPSLILFEWPEHGRKCLKHCEGAISGHCIDDEHNILRTGFVAVELYFSEHNCTRPCLDNLLEMNELFRYWQQPFEGHEHKINKKMGYKNLLGNLPFSYGSTQTIGEKNNPLDLYLERWASLLDIPIRDREGNNWLLFPQQWVQNARKFVSGEDKISQGWAIYSDSRTFVWTCAILENGGDDLRKRFNTTAQKAWNFGHWIKLLNVDPPGENVDKTHQKITDFEKTWAEERTYKRWEECGTFYGFNYHCGVMLGPPFNEPEPPLWRHFGQMYFDQILLLLYIRVALFRFSMELNRISANVLAEKGGDVSKFSKWRREFQKLRWSFALFTDLYQFPLLSNQQQGIEMYSLARTHMDADALFKEVKEEIQDSHEYLFTKEAIEQSEMMGRLTVVATIGLCLGLAFSFLGMNILQKELSEKYTGWSLLTTSILISLILLMLTVSLSARIITLWKMIGNGIKRITRRRK